ncbi:MAG: site-2 protease family protein [Fimbriimonadales bacterium]
MDSVFIIKLIVLFGSIALHEFGHAKSADSAGDPTPSSFGRVTLNPVAHFDPLGAMLIVMSSLAGFGIGWGKPVPINPAKMQHPRWDAFQSVAWGPLTNVIIAVVFAFIFRVITKDGIDMSSFAVQFCFWAVLLNVGLALFNLLPIGPLDGHWLLGLLMPEPMGARFMLWSRTTGTMILFGIILLDNLVLRQQGHPGILGTILYQPASYIMTLLLGH